MLLTKDDITNLKDCKYKILEVKEWGGEVKLKTLSVAAQIKYEKFQAENKEDNVIVGLVAACCVDENDNYLFTVDDLRNKSARVVCRLFRECVELNSLNSEAVENIAKNS